MRVIATAGHVDHGKSALVLALTGTDPDRFEEEQRRGLTIDLGFAHTVLPSGEGVSFVDVPGGLVPQSDGIELQPDEVDRYVADAAETFAYAEGPLAMDATSAASGDANAQTPMLHLASYRPDGPAAAPRLAPNTTVIHKTVEEEEEDEEATDLLVNAQTKDLTVGRGDTLASLFENGSP